MALVGISARWTSSETTSRPSSRAVKSLKTVFDLTNGVRKPATIAARRPGRAAMANLPVSGAGHSVHDSARQRQKQLLTAESRRFGGFAESFFLKKKISALLRASAVRLKPLPFP